MSKNAKNIISWFIICTMPLWFVLLVYFHSFIVLILWYLVLLIIFIALVIIAVSTINFMLLEISQTALQLHGKIYIFLDERFPD